MPLSQTRLAAAIKTAYTNTDWNGTEADAALDVFCLKLATEIVNEIKNNALVTTTGTATNHTGTIS